MDEPTKDDLITLWDKLLGEGIKSVRIDIDRETAGVTATSTIWAETGHGAIGVRLGLLNIATRWQQIADSSASDEEWEFLTGSEAIAIIRAVESARPDEIDATYSLDGQPVNTR